MFAKSFTLLCLLPIIIATPLSEASNNLAFETSLHCGNQDSVTAGNYSLLLNHWGLSDAMSGSGCAAITSLRDTTIAWKNYWTWVGGTKVKSFTNMQLNRGLNKQLSAIKSFHAAWTWSQTSSGEVVSNVAYDLFTSYTPGGYNVNEIMIWLADYNAGPISASYNSNGRAIPVASDIFLADHTWDLFYGYNGANDVYSFLLSRSRPIKSFRGDLNVFLKYMTETQRISNEEFIKTAQGGSEATSGSATFTTWTYSLVID